MKKIYWTCLLMLLLVSLKSCQLADESVQKTPVSRTEFSDQIIGEVKKWYGSSPKINGHRSKQIWARAKVYGDASNSEKAVVVVPVLAYSPKQVASIYSLIAYRNKGKLAGFIVQVTPDKKRLKQKDSIGFTGQVKLKLHTGKQMHTFKFKDGIDLMYKRGNGSSFRTMDEGDDGGDDPWGDDPWGDDPGGDDPWGDDPWEDPWDGDGDGDGNNDDDPTIMLDEVVILGAPWVDDTYVIWFDGPSFSSYFDGASYDPTWAISDYDGDGNPDVGVPVGDIPAPEEPGVPDDKKITDRAAYLRCFNLGAGALLTISADQPIANSDDCNDGSDVGHAFITITQGNVTRTMGFYPTGAVTPVSPGSGGSLANDQGHYYDVSVTVGISSSELSSLISYITSNTPGTYNLNNNNCTSWVIGCGPSAGLNLPANAGSWFLGGGLCPGVFGQDLRGYAPTDGWATADYDGGFAPENQGDCN